MTRVKADWMIPRYRILEAAKDTALAFSCPDNYAEEIEEAWKFAKGYIRFTFCGLVDDDARMEAQQLLGRIETRFKNALRRKLSTDEEETA